MSDGTVGAAAGSLPSYDKLMWPTLRALRELGGSGSIQEIDSKVAMLEGFSDAQLSVPHKDGPQTEIGYRLAWARTYLGKGGAIANSDRGVWALTAQGATMTAEDVCQIPARVRRESTRLRRQQEHRDSGPASELDGATPATRPLDLDPADESWRDALLSVIQEASPESFERLAQRLLREAGFTRVEVTGRSGDGGIDGVGVLRLSLVGFQVLYQAKRVKGALGAPVVRDFRGAMTGRADKGIIITTGSFTPEAKREATRDGAPPIELIDGTQLCDILRKYNLGVHPVTLIRIDREWFANLPR
jgi:restriction system protein